MDYTWGFSRPLFSFWNFGNEHVFLSQWWTWTSQETINFSENAAQYSLGTKNKLASQSCFLHIELFWKHSHCMKADWSQGNLICCDFRAIRPSHRNSQGKMASGTALKSLKIQFFFLRYSLFFFNWIHQRGSSPHINRKILSREK